MAHLTPERLGNGDATFDELLAYTDQLVWSDQVWYVEQHRNMGAGHPDININGGFLVSDMFKLRRECFNYCRSKVIEFRLLKASADDARLELMQIVHLHSDWSDKAWSMSVPAPNQCVYWRLKRDQLVLSLGMSRQWLFAGIFVLGLCISGFLWSMQQNVIYRSPRLMLPSVSSTANDTFASILSLPAGIHNVVNDTARLSHLGTTLLPIVIVLRQSFLEIIKAQSGVLQEAQSDGMVLSSQFRVLDARTRDFHNSLNKFDTDMWATITLVKRQLEACVVEAERRLDMLVAPSILTDFAFPASVAASSICVSSLVLFPPTNLIMSTCVASVTSLAHTFCLVTPASWTLCQPSRRLAAYFSPTDDESMERNNQAVTELLNVIESQYHLLREDAVDSVRTGGAVLLTFDRIHERLRRAPPDNVDPPAIEHQLGPVLPLQKAQRDAQDIFLDILAVLDDLEKHVSKLGYYTSEVRGLAQVQYLMSLSEIVGLLPSAKVLSQAALNYESEKQKAISG